MGTDSKTISARLPLELYEELLNTAIHKKLNKSDYLILNILTMKKLIAEKKDLIIYMEFVKQQLNKKEVPDVETFIEFVEQFLSHIN